MADGSRGSDPIDSPAALDPRLMIWLSPAFPVGSFAYSHGLEWAAHVGTLTDRATLEAWIGDLITHGSLGTDLVLLAATWRAVSAGDGKAVIEALELAAALQPSGERHLETTTQGHAFLAQISASWPCEAVERARRTWDGPVAYPAAFALAAAGHAIALRPALEAFGVAFVSTLASAAIRLSVIGQTDGQRVIAALHPVVARAATHAETSTLADVGGATLASDLGSLLHETQYSRLFRS